MADTAFFAQLKFGTGGPSLSTMLSAAASVGTGGDSFSGITLPLYLHEPKVTVVRGFCKPVSAFGLMGFRDKVKGAVSNANQQQAQEEDLDCSVEWQFGYTQVRLRLSNPCAFPCSPARVHCPDAHRTLGRKCPTSSP